MGYCQKYRHSDLETTRKQAKYWSMKCIFCNQVEENKFAFVLKDNYPVTPGHRLIIPKRHVRDFFSLNKDEILHIYDLILSQKKLLEKFDDTISGFNIGMNCGENAGQTIFHCHVHLIPRRSGDVKNPRGGVRHVISGKGDYSIEDLIRKEDLL